MLYMTRRARIDFPGALNHIMVRGIERSDLFKDDTDREVFLKRFVSVLEETGTICYAFALMTNHFHLLLETVDASISIAMQKLLTGYAIDFNYRHQRSGKLYQNRFKSILCDKEEYLLELVRYIHLNPLRVGLVPTLNQLDNYPWTGHSVYMDRQQASWLESDEILSMFYQQPKRAREAYREFVKEGVGKEEEIDLSGGGLIRSMGGVGEVLRLEKKGDKEESDERILGSGQFIEEALKRADLRLCRAEKLKQEGWTFELILEKAAMMVDVEVDDLKYKGRNNARSVGRALACKWAIEDVGLLSSEVSEKLSIGRSAVSQMKARGRMIEKEQGISIDDVN